MMAIADGDVATAASDLARFRSHSESGKAHGQRTAMSMELLLANSREDLKTVDLDLQRLRSIDERASHHGEHLTFAIALFLAHRSRGEVDEATNRFVDYLRNRRRELYPAAPLVPLLGLKGEDFDAVVNIIATNATTWRTRTGITPPAPFGRSP